MARAASREVNAVGRAQDETTRRTGNLCLAPIGGHLPRSKESRAFPAGALRLDNFQDTRYLRKVFGKASRRGQRDRQPERKDDPVTIASPVRVVIAMTPLLERQ